MSDQKCACDDPEIPTFCNRCGYTRDPWQPIETAPPAWRIVILFIPREEGNWEMRIGWIDGADWRSDLGLFRGDQPTHWMPLPAPPEVPRA